MVRVIFSLDTEDYITPQHDDAVEFWAKLFAERKIRGCFNVVAEYARALKARKRGDIINLVSGNEADYHSNVHSVHPTFPEYLDTMDWDDGINEVIRKEAEGIKDVEDIFGQHPSSYMQPGGSFAPQVLYAMCQMGIPVMTWTFLSSLSKLKPLWYCSALEGILWNLGFDDYFETGDFEKMKAGFERIYEKEKNLPDGLIVLGTHPCKLVAAEFWDGVNFNGRNTAPWAWKPAALRPQAAFESLKKGITDFTDWVLAKPGVEVITYGELYRQYKLPAKEKVALKELRSLAESTVKELGYTKPGKGYFSPAEIFSLFSSALEILLKNVPCLPASLCKKQQGLFRISRISKER